MSDAMRLAGPPTAPAPKRPHAPVSSDLLDMEGCAEELGVSRRTLERLLNNKAWQGPRPFKLSPQSRKNLFLARDVRRYRDAVSLLALRDAKPDESDHE